MNIGKKLKEARMQHGLTQERISEEIQVSRQTISNWENEKSYPDIISIIKLSELYEISLDELLKGDDEIINHLDKCTNTVKSNRKLSIIVMISLVVIAALLIFMGDRSSILIWVAMLLEFGLLCVVGFSDAPEVSKHIRIASRVLMIICVLIYLGLVVVCGLAAFDAFQSGRSETGVKLLITGVLVVVCVYFLIIRKLIKILTQGRSSNRSI